MFSDPFTAVMALILLAFVGTLAVFFRIWRELDSVRTALKEMQETVRLYAADSAQQTREIELMLRDVCCGGTKEAQTGPDCLGELLERGLPNLSGSAYAPSQPQEKRTNDSASGYDDDDDLIRRLGGGIDRGTVSR